MKTGLFNLAKRINQKMISILHKELERKVAKLKLMKLEVMEPKVKNNTVHHLIIWL